MVRKYGTTKRKGNDAESEKISFWDVDDEGWWKKINNFNHKMINFLIHIIFISIHLLSILFFSSSRMSCLFREISNLFKIQVLISIYEWMNECIHSDHSPSFLPSRTIEGGVWGRISKGSHIFASSVFNMKQLKWRWNTEQHINGRHKISSVILLSSNPMERKSHWSRHVAVVFCLLFWLPFGKGVH